VEDLKTFMVKGSPLLADMAFVTKRYGTEGLEKVLDTMPPEHAEVYRKKPLVSSWYPMELRIQILLALDRLYAKGDMDYFFEVGYHQADYNLKQYYKSFMRMIGPKRIMSMSPLYWRLIYKTSSIEMVAEQKGAEIKVFDYPKIGVYNCHVIRGYIHRTAEIAGDKRSNVTSEEPTCINRGDSNCKFVLTWT
jgi:predicted hydrocarbon binding protein